MKKIIIITVLSLLVISILMAEEVERDVVVVETFTATWCPYCPGCAMGIDDLIANGCDVAVVGYHPSSSDPFYNNYALYRKNYYGSIVTGYPTAIFDGVLSHVGGSHTQSMYPYYLPRYNQRKAINSSFTIEINGNNIGLNYDITVTVNKVAVTSSTNMVLHLSLTESDIQYNWQGQTELNFVERLMVPNQYGTALDFSLDSTNTVDLSFTLNPSWVADNCELAAFIQDTDTKEVLQGSKESLSDLVPPLIADFTADPTSGVAPLTVNFFDQSTSGCPIIFWSWDFDNDGTTDSNEMNPTYTYQQAGTYTVSLTVIDEAASVDTEIKEDFITVTTTGAEDNIIAPVEDNLQQNYPNPFFAKGVSSESSSTKISYSLNKKQALKTSICIYNVKGEVVREFNNLPLAGNYGEIEWDGKDHSGKSVSNGVYFYKLSAGNKSIFKKMLLLN